MNDRKFYFCFRNWDVIRDSRTAVLTYIITMQTKSIHISYDCYIEIFTFYYIIHKSTYGIM